MFYLKKLLSTAWIIALFATTACMLSSDGQTKINTEFKKHKRELFEHVSKEATPTGCSFLTVLSTLGDGDDILGGYNEYGIRAAAKCDESIEQYNVRIEVLQPSHKLNAIICSALGLFQYKVTQGGKIRDTEWYLSPQSSILPTKTRADWSKTLANISDALATSLSTYKKYLLSFPANLIEEVEDLVSELENTANIRDNEYIQGMTSPQINQQIASDVHAKGLNSALYRQKLAERLEELSAYVRAYRIRQRELADEIITSLESGTELSGSLN